ncbi:MAG: LysR family transcriptional regulator [Hyphomicrobium sp.]|jgi:DNA-binding transcriptional LysR family regulator|nr:LysR family transcriptional regulator [Hyphomicrobium sp.]
MHLTQRQLKIFVALSHALSFSRCAEQLHVTQPTLSKIVREIEEVIGVQLFERTTRMVRLTAEGAMLLPIASRMIENYEAGLAELQGFAKGHAHTLAIAATPSCAASLLPGCLKRMRTGFPDLRIAVHDVSAEQTLELLRGRKVAVALTALLPGLMNDKDLEAVELMTDTFVLVASAHSQLELEGKIWSETVLGQLPIITMPRGTSTRLALDLSLLDDSATCSQMLELRDLVTIKKFVECDVGVAVLPELAARLITDDKIKVIHLQDAPKRSLGVVTRRGETASMICNKFASCIRQISSPDARELG